MPADDRQLLLFVGLPIPQAAARVCRRCPSTRAAAAPWEQLPLALVLRGLERDIDTAYDYPVHTVIPAAVAPRVQVTAPASIWDAARSASLALRLGRFGDAAGFQPPRYGRTVRDGDVVRHIAMRQEDTEEWAERERARRARQRPPKPTKKARTRSKKLLALVGDDDDGN